jgi:hypothetical protein
MFLPFQRPRIPRKNTGNWNNLAEMDSVKNTTRYSSIYSHFQYQKRFEPSQLARVAEISHGAPNKWIIAHINVKFRKDGYEPWCYGRWV